MPSALGRRLRWQRTHKFDPINRNTKEYINILPYIVPKKILRTNKSKIRSSYLENILTSHFFKPFLSLMFLSLALVSSEFFASSNMKGNVVFPLMYIKEIQYQKYLNCRGSNWILLCVDHLTSWSQLFPWKMHPEKLLSVLEKTKWDKSKSIKEILKNTSYR